MAIVAIGAAIAAVAPFDVFFNFATLGSPGLRVFALLAVAAVGLKFAAKIGAPIESRGLKHPVLTPLLIAAGVAVYVTLIDVWVFRSILMSGYLNFIPESGLVDRLSYFMLRAFNESILYRLFLSSILVWALGQLWRGDDGLPANRAYWVGIVIAQAVNIAINVTFLNGFSTTPAFLLHDALRYVTPGVLWGYLYFRHGFTTHEIAAVGTHIFLQPMLSVVL